MSIKRVIAVAGAASLAAAIAVAATASVMSVQVRKAELRDTPSYLGHIVSSLAYGEKVAVQSENGAWVQVTVNGQAGWLHTSALTTKNITIKSGAGAQTSASSGEMALAGKGFNSDVEAQFKANHKEIDFTWVDKMEKIRIPVSEIRDFTRDGKLSGQGGGK